MQCLTGGGREACMGRRLMSACTVYPVFLRTKHVAFVLHNSVYLRNGMMLAVPLYPALLYKEIPRNSSKIKRAGFGLAFNISSPPNVICHNVIPGGAMGGFAMQSHTPISLRMVFFWGLASGGLHGRAHKKKVVVFHVVALFWRIMLCWESSSVLHCRSSLIIARMSAATVQVV